MMNETAQKTGSTNGTLGTWASHVDETKRGLAKLLARENITIIHRPAETASFNVQTRELVLPVWENITVDQYDLLIGHEVGHAKFTDEVAILEECAKFKGLHSYVNVIEDARIERLMKDEYPGLRASFRRGYQDFYHNGPLFHNLKPAASYSFIDRINLHYKVGGCVAVPFSTQEQTVLDRINKLRSFREAFNLAKELWQEAKDQSQNQPQPAPEQKGKSKQKSQSNQGAPEQSQSGDAESAGDESGDESEKSTGADGDSESNESESGDESSSDGESSGSASADGDGAGDESDTEEAKADKAGDGKGTQKKTGQTDPVAETDLANEKALAEMGREAMENFSVDADVPSQWSFGVLSDEVVKFHTVTNAQFVDDVTAYINNSHGFRASVEKVTADFHKKYTATVKYMAGEFDRKKTAKLMERARASRTGRLDMNKLHAYKFRDDLFQSVVTTPKGKSHGIVAVIDGSSSMTSCMMDTVHQAMFFGAFAQRLRIPFQAYLFLSDREQKSKYARAATETPYPYVKDQVFPSPSMEMVCILDTMAPKWSTQVECAAALAHRWSPDHRYSYGYDNNYFNGLPYTSLMSTPLESAMLLAERYVAKMKAAYNLDKMTLLSVTDGDDTDGVIVPLQQYADVYDAQRAAAVKSTTGRPKAAIGAWTVMFGAGLSPAFLRDRVGRKTYVNVEDRQQDANWAATDAKYRGARYTSLVNGMMTALVGVIQSRHDARVINLMLVSSGRRYGNALSAARSFFTARGQRVDAPVIVADPMDANKTVEKVIHDEGVFVLPAEHCFADTSVLVGTDTLDLDDNTFETLDTSKLTARQIASKFKKAQLDAVANKVFVRAVLPSLI